MFCAQGGRAMRAQSTMYGKMSAFLRARNFTCYFRGKFLALLFFVHGADVEDL